MAETNKITVAKLSQQISITSTEKNEQILLDINPKIANECVELLNHSLNAEQIINIDFDDLKEIALGKQVINVGKFYSPDCDVEGFDNIVINADEEQATDLVVFFEASPDTSVDTITEAIESFMMNFACETNIIFAANAESGEKGLTLQWICMK